MKHTCKLNQCHDADGLVWEAHFDQVTILPSLFTWIATQAFSIAFFGLNRQKSKIITMHYKWFLHWTQLWMEKWQSLPICCQVAEVWLPLSIYITCEPMWLFSWQETISNCLPKYQATCCNHVQLETNCIMNFWCTHICSLSISYSLTPNDVVVCCSPGGLWFF